MAPPEVKQKLDEEARRLVRLFEEKGIPASDRFRFADYQVQIPIGREVLIVYYSPKRDRFRYVDAKLDRYREAVWGCLAPHPNHLSLYTDGSFLPGRSSEVGWAFVAVCDGKVIETQSGIVDENLPIAPSSIHQIAGELYAVYQAVDWMAQKDYAEATIYHDYKGIADWIEGRWKIKNPIVGYFVRAIQAKISLQKIRFVHIEAHSGVRYNEWADQLARQAILNR